jgi:hypothetical protein
MRADTNPLMYLFYTLFKELIMIQGCQLKGVKLLLLSVVRLIGSYAGRVFWIDISNPLVVESRSAPLLIPNSVTVHDPETIPRAFHHLTIFPWHSKWSPSERFPSKILYQFRVSVMRSIVSPIHRNFHDAVVRWVTLESGCNHGDLIFWHILYVTREPSQRTVG